MSQIFIQNKIAFVWDFDKTLIPNYMQQPLFDKFGVDANNFWKEVDHLKPEYMKSGIDLVNRDTLYLNHILTYVKAGIFKNLNNAMLRELGKEIEFYEGLPEFFPLLQERITNDKKFNVHDIKVEHYIVSTGLRQMILGSRIAKYTDFAWGCEFTEYSPPPNFLEEPELNFEQVISAVAYAIDNTSKTRALFEINKGTNKTKIDVNAKVKKENRRIPFRNMIYIADGPSDIPAFSLVNSYGGRTFAVYQPRSHPHFCQANLLQSQGRVQSFGEANYTEGSQTFMWLYNAAIEIAERITAERQAAIDNETGKPPVHI